MSKDLFMMMREQEIATSNFLPTKKEVQKTSKEFAQSIIKNGEHNLYEIYSQAIRMKEAISTIESELKEKLPDESFESFGLKATFKNGGSKLNLQEDEIYNSLKKDLDDRVELLKLAQKQVVIDSYGNDVPKVSLSYIKSSLTVSF